MSRQTTLNPKPKFKGELFDWRRFTGAKAKKLTHVNRKGEKVTTTLEPNGIFAYRELKKRGVDKPLIQIVLKQDNMSMDYIVTPGVFKKLIAESKKSTLPKPLRSTPKEEKAVAQKDAPVKKGKEKKQDLVPKIKKADTLKVEAEEVIEDNKPSGLEIAEPLHTAVSEAFRENKDSFREVCEAHSLSSSDVLTPVKGEVLENDSFHIIFSSKTKARNYIKKFLTRMLALDTSEEESDAMTSEDVIKVFLAKK